MGQKRTLSGWLTNRYLLIIRNEENFAEKRTISFNYARVLLLFAGFSVLMLLLAIYFVSTILAQWLDPRHAQMVANRQLLELSQQLDSLERASNARDKYLENIKIILSGGDSTYSALVASEQQISFDAKEALESGLHVVDSQFRAQYEENDLDLVKFANYESDELRDIYLFKPIEGIVSDPFDARINHFGTDVVAKENEPVKSVAEGVVVFSSWTLDNGYVIGVQHSRGNLISVYKHNSELLKNVGNFVASGEVIAIIGNTGELTSGPHLHFELWHKGNAVNPENYIAF